MTYPGPVKKAAAKAKGWRTILFNVGIMFLVVLAEVATYLTAVNWREYVAPEWLPFVISGVNIANIAMRYVTTGPTPLRERVERWRS